MPVPIQILILAAGRAQRMGSTKQLLAFKEQTLLGTVIQVANSLFLGKPMVILGHKADEIRMSIPDEQANLKVNSYWSSGMGNTLAYAVKTASELNPDVQALLVLLADQPKISRAHLLRLVKEYKEKRSPIIATAYPNGGGVPAVFDKSIFPELMKLSGDKGARQIIRNHEAAVLLVPHEDEVLDIDTPEDYQRLLGGQ